MSFNVRLFGYSGIIQVGQSHAQQYSGDAVFLNEEPCLWSQLLVCDGSTVATSARITTVPDGTQMVCVEVPDNHEIRYEVVQPGAAARAVSSSSRRGSGFFNLAWSPGYTLSIIDAVPVVVPPVAPATTWNPADKDVGVTLSGGNLTYTGSQGARSTNPLSTGKVYWEVLVNQAAGDTAWNIGITNSSYAFVTLQGAGDIRFIILIDGHASNGAIGVGSAVANGDTVCLAADLDAKKVWFRKNGGNWNSSALNDPATGVGGNAFPIAGPYHAGVASNAGTTSFTANFGATPFSFTKPVGFTSWNGLV